MAEIKRIRCGNVNTYLIEEHGRAILVDTGRIGSEEKILAQCQKTKVELIVLTHGHVDHVQNTACLKKELGVPVALHKKDLNLIKDGIHEPLRYQGFLGMVVAEVSAKSYETDRIYPGYLFKRGRMAEGLRDQWQNHRASRAYQRVHRN